jgi:hypothetical protein
MPFGGLWKMYLGRPAVYKLSPSLSPQAKGARRAIREVIARGGEDKEESWLFGGIFLLLNLGRGHLDRWSFQTSDFGQLLDF